MATSTRTEKGVGLTVLFVIVALVGALTMGLAAEDQVIAAVGFGIAVISGSLAVAARHVYT